MTHDRDSDDKDSNDDERVRVRAVVTASPETWALVDEDRLKVSPSGALDRGPFLLDFYLKRRQQDSQ